MKKMNENPAQPVRVCAEKINRRATLYPILVHNGYAKTPTPTSSIKMGELCEIFLDKDVYEPGDTVTGKVVCNFETENQVNGIRVLIKGRAKVYWKEGRYTVYQDDKTYFEFETALVDNDTSFATGTHEFPISFDLPGTLPSSMEETHGNVRYKVQAVVGRSWSFDYVCRLPFTVNAIHNLNQFEEINQPIQCIEEKIPFALFGESPPIKILVNLPQSCYAINDTISFFVKVINESAIGIEDVRFRIVQGYNFFARNRSMQHISYESDEYVSTEVKVEGESENQWNLKITVPSDIFIGVLDDCDIIKIFWKLRGEVCLPFPHTNFTIDVPLVLGLRD